MAYLRTKNNGLNSLFHFSLFSFHHASISFYFILLFFTASSTSFLPFPSLIHNSLNLACSIVSELSSFVFTFAQRTSHSINNVSVLARQTLSSSGSINQQFSIHFGYFLICLYFIQSLRLSGRKDLLSFAKEQSAAVALMRRYTSSSSEFVGASSQGKSVVLFHSSDLLHVTSFNSKVQRIAVIGGGSGGLSFCIQMFEQLKRHQSKLLQRFQFEFWLFEHSEKVRQWGRRWKFERFNPKLYRLDQDWRMASILITLTSTV